MDPRAFCLSVGEGLAGAELLEAVALDDDSARFAVDAQRGLGTATRHLDVGTADRNTRTDLWAAILRSVLLVVDSSAPGSDGS